MQLFSAGTIAMTTSSHGGGVAFAAHVVGFVVGMGAVFLFRKRERDPWEQANYY
jgi:membrane associated rhomboid family serine protease